MADVFLREKRSEIMASIRSRDTKPELWVRARLASAGYKLRLNDETLPGSPDIVVPGKRAVVFVHGCFWHGHGCRGARRPSSNVAYWREKLETNKRRDARNARQLRRLGWSVYVVWGCALERNTERVIRRLRKR